MKQQLLIATLILSSVPAFSQKEKIAEIQRDLLLMQDQIRALQRSQDEKLAAMQVLLQQTLDTANKANTSVAVLDNALRERLKEQEKTLVLPVANVGSRVDTMSSEFAGVKEAMGDLMARMAKLQNQISDINSAIKVMATPPAPPPAPAASNPNGVPAGVTAEGLYNNALRDKSSGNSELAIQQFEDYLKYFGNTDLAPNAQYYIGEIKYLKGDLDGALMAFDTLLERYPDNPKTSDAMLQKGRALSKAGFKAEARQEFTALVKKFPNHENAAKARTELAALNNAPAGRTPARTKKK